MRAVTAALALLLLGLAAAGCERPPPEAFVAAPARTLSGEPAGSNARGEACTAMPGAKPPADAPVRRAREVFCGGWTQPAARILELDGPRDAATLRQYAEGGVWRRWLDGRIACEGSGAEETRLANGAAAVLLRCTRRAGGWPHLVLVAAGPEGPVLADGLTAALPVIERMVAEGGPAPAIAAAAVPRAAGRSDAMRIAVARLSAEAYGAADVGRYEQLMALGRDLNQAEAFAAAEDAYRAALAIQQRVLGREDPNTVAPMLNLALNLSNQGRFNQSRPLLDNAAVLAPRAADPTARARVVHYRGVDALNRGQAEEAVALLARAEGMYAQVAPVTVAALAAMSPQEAGGEELILDQVSQSAVLGLAEARRYRGIALARLGRTADSLAAVGEARTLLRKAGMEPGLMVGRGLRTLGAAVEASGRQRDAVPLYAASATRFAAGLPGERPEGLTRFLAGAGQLQAGRRGEALASFRAGAQVLRARQIGVPVELMIPYLDALAADAAAKPAEAAALHAEMFEAAQSARRDATARLVAQAAARLGAAGGDRRVSEAVRHLQDRDRELRALLSARDMADTAGIAEIDARIAEAQQSRAEAEAAVAAAAPGYRQLLQAAAPAPAVAAALGPADAFVTMLLGERHGYAFAVRADGSLLARRVALGEAEAAALVERVRAGMVLRQDNTPEPFDTAAAEALHAGLLRPLAPALDGAETLLVAADGPLLAIPFGLLLTGPAQPDALQAAPWLLRRHAVVHVPSAQTLVSQRAARAGAASAAPLPYAGFGDPVMPGAAQLHRSFPSDRCADDAEIARELGPLPGTRAEVLAAQRLLRAQPGAVRLGQEFTAQAIRAAGLDRFRVVHFATHALLPGEGSCLREPSLVVSAPRGAAEAAAAFVPASAFLDLKLDADLVILSACNTGTTLGGSGSGGEGLSAMARAMFFAGARGVLATHWAVDDEAAELTVTAALRRQAERGMGSAAALRGAQLLLLDEAGRQLPPGWAHPFYWAPFALIGDGQRGPAVRG